jgi:uncharacterized protein
VNIFADTSGFFSVLDASDDNHDEALSQWDHLTGDAGCRIVTSVYVVVETCTLFQRRLGMRAVRLFLDDALPLVDILPIREEEHAAAIALLLTCGRNGPSLVDCSSFILMERAGIRQAFAFDKHFEARGYTGNL